MRQSVLERGLLLGKILTDFLLVAVSFLIAYGLKFKLHFISSLLFHRAYGTVYENAQIEPYVAALGVVTLVAIASFFISGMYQIYRGTLAVPTEAVKIVKGVTGSVLLLMAMSFVYKPFPGSRFVMIYFWLIAVVLLVLSRLAFAALADWFYAKGIGNVNAVILGSDTLAGIMGSRIIYSPSLGYKLMGFASEHPMDPVPYALRHSYRYLGTESNLDAILHDENISVLISSAPGLPNPRLVELCKRQGARLLVASDVNQFYFDLDRLDDIPVMALKSYPLDRPVSRLFKRGFDLCLLVALLPVVLPVLAIVAGVIALMDGRPILYRQDRLGRDGSIFKLLKFRTMITDAERQSGPVFAAQGDSRVTRLGGFLRRSSLDELPQVINVLMGDMSLVGPRPERRYFYDAFKDGVPMFKERLRVKPGITGWAQIHGRSGLSHRIEEKLVYDLYYIDQWSWLLDLKILIKTFAVVVSQHEAY